MPEQKIITRLHSGNEKTFQEIFKQYYLPIRSFAWRFVKDNDVAEDIVQESFVHVWEKRITFNTLQEIKTYLYTCVRNACLDYLKHENIKQKYETNMLRTLSPTEEEACILEEEIDTLIYQVIASLPRQARNIVMMTLNGSSNIEIATALNITVNTVKATKNKAYQTLRKRLRDLQWLLVLLMG